MKTNFHITEKSGYTPFSFVLSENYKSPDNFKILLIIPCSKDKPYSNSFTHQTVKNFLGNLKGIHKVTLSGLYGPVPYEMENISDAVTSYDYLLTPEAYRQIALVSGRLALFLNNNKSNYDIIAGYATIEPYRSIIEAAFLNCGKGKIFPSMPLQLSIEEFSKPENLNELKDYFKDAVTVRSSI